MHEATLDEHGRPEPPPAGDEVETLLGFLEFQRATLWWKTQGLAEDGLRARLHPTTMTLGGLLKHLAWVEEYWTSRRLHGREPGPPWDAVEWDADPDWEWDSAAVDSPETLRSLWQEATDRARIDVTAALDERGLDGELAVQWPDGTAPSVRWMLVHLIEEYARHNGHADLLRQAVDGQVGE